MTSHYSGQSGIMERRDKFAGERIVQGFRCGIDGFWRVYGLALESGVCHSLVPSAAPVSTPMKGARTGTWPISSKKVKSRRFTWSIT